MTEPAFPLISQTRSKLFNFQSINFYIERWHNGCQTSFRLLEHNPPKSFCSWVHYEKRSEYQKIIRRITAFRGLFADACLQRQRPNGENPKKQSSIRRRNKKHRAKKEARPRSGRKSERTILRFARRRNTKDHYSIKI